MKRKRLTYLVISLSCLTAAAVVVVHFSTNPAEENQETSSSGGNRSRHSKPGLHQSGNISGQKPDLRQLHGAALFAALETAEESEFLKLADRFLAGDKNGSEFRTFWRLWGRRFPASAARFLTAQSSSPGHARPALGIVVEAWAELAPETSVGYLSKNQDAPWFDEVYLKYLSGCALKDLKLATGQFTSQVAASCDRLYAEKAIGVLIGRSFESGGAKSVIKLVQ